MRLIWVVSLAAAGAWAAASAAGSSSGPSPSQPTQLPAIRCPASLHDAFARGAASSAITVQADVSSGFSSCAYGSAAGKAKACSAASVTIDTNPQAFKDFQRWVVETGQNAGAGPGEDLAPEAIIGIGVEADWVLARSPSRLQTTTAGSPSD